MNREDFIPGMEVELVARDEDATPISAPIGARGAVVAKLADGSEEKWFNEEVLVIFPGWPKKHWNSSRTDGAWDCFPAEIRPVATNSRLEKFEVE